MINDVIAGNDGGNAGTRDAAHGAGAVLDHGGVPYPDARHVGNGIVFSARIAADAQPQFPRAHALSRNDGRGSGFRGSRRSGGNSGKGAKRGDSHGAFDEISADHASS